MKPKPRPKRASRASKRALPRQVFWFGNGQAQGRGDMKEMLGGKGANLAEMTRLGVPVPPGFTITTEVCSAFNARGGKLPEAVKQSALAALAKIERSVGKRFGDAGNPLLVSVRSGARASMPGMMDTILNLGLNDATVEGLAARAGRALRVRLLPPLRRDVRRRRARGRAARALRDAPRGA